MTPDFSGVILYFHSRGAFIDPVGILILFHSDKPVYG